MKTSDNQTTDRADETTYSAGISQDEIQAAIHAGERLRSETIHRAFVTAFRFLKQAPSRLFSAGTHRHA